MGARADDKTTRPARAAVKTSEAKDADAKAGVSPVTPADVYVGLRIRERRLMLGLSQQQLGAQVGVTTQQTHKYETGRNRLSVGRLYAFSQALDVPASWFFEGFGAEPSETPVSERHRLSLEMARNFTAIDNQKLQEALTAMARAMVSPEKEDEKKD